VVSAMLGCIDRPMAAPFALLSTVGPVASIDYFTTPCVEMSFILLAFFILFSYILMHIFSPVFSGFALIKPMSEPMCGLAHKGIAQGSNRAKQARIAVWISEAMEIPTP